MKESTKDKAAGTAREATGKLKKKVGEQTEDRDLESEGRLESGLGKAQKKKGDIEKVFDK